MKISGIYAILNILNDKVYVGNASYIKRRWKNHRFYLNSNAHYNKHLQRSWNKEGACNFLFVVLEYCSVNILVEREQYWINLTRCYDPEFGYNYRRIAESNLGIKFSAETRTRMSLSFKQRRLTAEQKLHLSNINMGHRHSEETKKKMSVVTKGRKAVNRNLDKWPHEKGRRCSCGECCKKKRTEFIGSWL